MRRIEGSGQTVSGAVVVVGFAGMRKHSRLGCSAVMEHRRVSCLVVDCSAVLERQTASSPAAVVGSHQS